MLPASICFTWQFLPAAAAAAEVLLPKVESTTVIVLPKPISLFCCFKAD